MNGATALPLVRTITPPKRASITITGTSQYFFRMRMKLQSSEMKEIKTCSELPAHGVRGGPRRGAIDPVRWGGPADPNPARVPAEKAK